MEYTVEQLVGKYVELRDSIKTIQDRAKADVEPLESAKVAIENALMKLAIDQKVTSFKTVAGTAFVAPKTFASVGDGDALIKYVTENKAYQLLTRAVSKAAVQEHIEAHGVPPPGVNWTQTKEIQVRRA